MTNVMAGRGPVDRTESYHRLRVEFDVLGGMISEFDATPVDRVDLRAQLVQRRALVRAQLASVMPATSGRQPVVLDPTQLAGLMSKQGQPLTPVITPDTAPTDDLSSAEVRMPPHHPALAHLHHHTGVVLVLLEGQAITLWWDDDGEMHELQPQQPGQHLFIPRGIVHSAINPYDQPARGAEIRANPVFNADNELVPTLQPQVVARIKAILAAV